MTQLEKIFDYNGVNITFKTNEGITYINATEMAKSFKKNIGHYLQNKSTEAYIQALENQRDRNSDVFDNQLVIISNKSATIDQSTWMHEDLALHFAQWLSPNFYIWCNARIKELLKFGFTATPQTLKDLVRNPKLIIELATELENERAEKDRLLAENAEQREIMVINEPKVKYHDAVLSAEGLMNATALAGSLNISAIKLNQLLHQKGVIFKCDGVWVLYAKYKQLDYARLISVPYSKGQGVIGTAQRLYWTEIGKKFVHELLNPVLKITTE